jgi:hypothetical protein
MLIEGTVDEGENAFTVHDLGDSLFDCWKLHLLILLRCF